ncbi:phage tail tape measure protein [Providencia hangzhouensis]|uniref:phage tail tape measure protein n=1 Tax=Providencia hangzhouensis TaxID=3031799 RepID=UPI0034DD1A81
MRELAFLLSLKNNLSAPLGQAQKSVERFAASSREAFAKIGIGVAGLWGVVTGVKNLLNPAHQVKMALDELSTRNISTQSLDKIYKEAQAFSTAYGQSAADFIQSATIIRSSLAGITEQELPRYTKAINTLAIASKVNAKEAADYMSDMANNFQSTAKTMGNIPFAEMMASKSAYMVQNFGTGLGEIKELIKSSKNTGTQFGIDMNEQLTVVGTLSMTKGTEGGGIYDTFLKSAVKGGQQLGVSLTDAKGQLLSFPDILDKLQAKFGNTIEGNLKAQNALNAAFGDGAQALTAAWGQADTLRKHMAQLGNTHGLDRSAQMAAKMTDLWARLDKVWERMRVSLGMRLMPAIEPLANKLIKIGEQLAKWMDMFPNITRMIGYAALSIIAFAGAGALVNIIMGVWGFIMKGILPVIKSIRFAFIGLRAVAVWVASGFMAITWPVLAVIAVIGALVVAVIKFWQPINAFISGFIEGFTEAWQALAPLSPAFQWIGNAIGVVSQEVSNLIDWFGDLLTPIQYTENELANVTSAGKAFGQAVAGALYIIMNPIETIGKLLDWLKTQFVALMRWIIDGCAELYNSVANTLNNLPGVEIDLIPTVANQNAQQVLNAGLQPLLDASGQIAPPAEVLPSPPGGGVGAVIGAGIGKQISNQTKNSTSKNETNVNTVNIYPQNKETFTSLLESQELNAG